MKEKDDSEDDDDDEEEEENGHWGRFSDLSLLCEFKEDKVSYTFQLPPHFSLCSSHSVIPLSTNETLFPTQTRLNDPCPPQFPI